MKSQNAQLKRAGSRIISISAALLIRSNTYRPAVLALLFAGATLFSTSAASAATISVINTNDSGPGSLRQALVDANDGDTIDFDSSLKGQKIALTSGQLNVNKGVTISGPGANHLAVDGNAQSRVFHVNPGKTVTIDGLTVANGASDYGGGIYKYGGVLTVSNCAISGNSATGNGGGIYNEAGTLTIINSTLSGNSAEYGAGGISNYADNARVAILMLNNCTLSGNSAGYGGGAITNGAFGGGASVTVSNSTITGNSAGYGGGILIGGGGPMGSFVVTVSNSTITSNSAADGGGIYNRAGNHQPVSLSVKNSTISGNLATGNGGGIYNNGQDGLAELELGSTILIAGSSGENIFNSGHGTVTSLGYNLSSDNGGGYLIGPGDQINTDPLLGPLQDNGGPTFTRALLPGSPAINAGDPSFTAPPSYDQRGPGFDRIVNGRVDIGSFEVQGPAPTPTATPCGSVWIERSPVPYNAGGVFAVSDGTFVYAGGGADLAKGIFHKDLLRYDPVNDSWTSLEPSPDYHYHSQAVYFDGNIYNIGGYNENLPEVTDTTRIYNIGIHTWTTGAPMPQPLAQMAIALWDGVIYVAGGNNSTDRINTLYAYHIDTNTWTARAPMPEPVTLSGFGVINGKLYIAGGSGNAGYLSTLYIYDIAINSWITSGANLLQAIARPGSAVLNGLLYLYGGRLRDLTPTNITQIYDPATNTWSYGPEMNVPLFSSYGTAFGNDSIVAPGGLDTNFVGLIDNEQLVNIACPTPTPTPSPTPTATATATTTTTPTATARPSPTSRPRPTPAPRP